MDENNLIVIVSYLDNLLQFEFDENANVGDLKKKIKERTGLEPAQQVLVWGNAAISDADITSDVCICHNFLSLTDFLDPFGGHGSRSKYNFFIL